MALIKDFIAGVHFLFRGFRYLFAHPRLWPWAILPTLLGLLLMGAMLGLFIHYYGDVYGWLSDHLGHITIADPDTWYWVALDGLLWVLDKFFQLLVILISIILLLIVGYAAALVIAAPFNDALSERVETLVTGREPPPFSWKKFVGDLLRILKIESIKAAILIAIPIVLFVLNFIPVVGAPLYVALTFFFGCWDLGFSFADLPMGRKVMPLGERWRFAKRQRWALVGLGVGFLIPFFSLLFAAPLTVGGTLLYLDREGWARPPSAPGA